MVGLLALVLHAEAQEGMAAMPSAAATPDYYVIQPGDTLWDISSRFLGDPYAWPELWSVNTYITNPHWIYPGNRIYFRLGDQLTPPSVSMDPGAVAEAPKEPEPVAAAPAEVACDFPPLYDRAFGDVRLHAPGTLANAGDLNVRGKVFAADVPGASIGEDEFVYLEMSDADDLECGALLGVYRREGGKVKSGGDKRYVYRVLATAQVVRVDGDIVTAKLRDSWFEVERGDAVGDPMDVNFRLDVDAPEGDHEAKVIARLNQTVQTLASTGETVFLDQGTDDGVDVGQALYLVDRRDGTNLTGPEDERLPERVVGRVVVVRAAEAWSTGVVVDAARDVQVGARVVTIPNPEE